MVDGRSRGSRSGGGDDGWEQELEEELRRQALRDRERALREEVRLALEEVERLRREKEEREKERE